MSKPLLLKTLLILTVLVLLLLAGLLWWQTPDLFSYFNQAFCAH